MFTKLTKEQLDKKVQFIDNYVQSKNAADGSKMDANANVSTKNIATLASEMHKDINIQINRRLMHTKITEEFDKELADEYIRQLEAHEIYKHDETSPSPYTYASTECVRVKIDEEFYVMPFSELYDSVVLEEEVLDTDKGVFAKYPENILIEDKDNKLTPITRLVKKKRHRDLVRVCLENAEDIIVTDNHPMIIGETKDETIPAEDSEGETQFRSVFGRIPQLPFALKVNTLSGLKEEPIQYIGESIRLMKNYQGSLYMNAEVNLDASAGYPLGFIMANGSLMEGNQDFKIVLKGNDFDKLFNTLLDSWGVNCYFDFSKNLIIDNPPFCKIMKEFLDDGFLPIDLPGLGDNFLLGIIEGYVDAVGVSCGDSSVYIPLKDRVLKSQLMNFLPQLGYWGKATTDGLEIFKSTQAASPLYSVKLSNLNFSEEVRNDRVEIVSVEKVTDESYLKLNDFIYDITTESNTFLCNNIWVHNCVSVSMYPFLLDGLKSLGGESAAPKHVESFCGSFVNLVFAISSQFAGACLYGEQRLNILDQGVPHSIKIKELVERFNLNKSFTNDQGVWEYADPEGLKVWEENRFVDIKRVYRRVYKDKIFRIKTASGKQVEVSKDHKFKIKQEERFVEIKAEDLVEGDLVVNAVYEEVNNYLGLDLNSRDYKLGQLLGFIKEFSYVKTEEHLLFKFEGEDKKYLPYLMELFKELYNVQGFVREGDSLELVFDISRVVKELATFFNSEDLLDLTKLNLNTCAGILDIILIKVKNYRYHGKEDFVAQVDELLKMFNVHSKKDCHTLYFDPHFNPELLRILDLSWEHMKKYCSYSTDQYEVIENIDYFYNDDYVYEIETSSHWYSAGGMVTHNCATVEFLMYFDHFLRKDYGDNYLEEQEYKVNNYLQQVVYSINQPAAARGFQCVREDTTQLSTPEGYKYLSELKEGDLCYVWVDGKIETQPIQKLNVYDFDGELMQFKGRNYQQTVTPNHRVLYKKPNTSEYVIKEAHEVFGHSELSCPVGSEGVEREDYGISDSLLKLCVATLTDGSIEDKSSGDNFSGRIRIYKSKNRFGYREIPEWLEEAGIGFTTSEAKGNDHGDMVVFNIPVMDSQIILRQLKGTKKEIPHFFKLLSKRQLEIVLSTWASFDGSNREEFAIQLQCDNDSIRDSLQELATLAGIGSEIYDREMTKYSSDEPCLVKYLKLFKRKDKRVSNYNLVPYTGKVWCPTTDAGVVIFREENKIPYISGNSIFWNISIFDKPYFESMFGDFVFPDMDRPKWETLDKLQRHFMKWFREERERAILTFPVVTAAMLSDGEKPKDQEYSKFLSEEMAKSNSFFIYLSESADSLASCCRLRNEISDNTFSYSLGAGGVATGSISVMTINMNRLEQDGRDLRKEIDKIHKYQYAYRKIMDDYKEAGMLPVYDAGFITLDKQFLTIGINGMLEAAEFNGIKADNNQEYKDFVSKKLQIIFEANRQAKEKYGIMFNTEFVPAENLGVKFANWDKSNSDKVYKVTTDDGKVLELMWNTEITLQDGSTKMIYQLEAGDDIKEIHESRLSRL